METSLLERVAHRVQPPQPPPRLLLFNQREWWGGVWAAWTWWTVSPSWKLCCDALFICGTGSFLCARVATVARKEGCLQSVGVGEKRGGLGRWWMGNPWWGGIVSGRAPLHSLLLQMLRCILIAFSLYAATGSMPNTSPLKTYSRNICFKMKILSNVQGVQKNVPSE